MTTKMKTKISKAAVRAFVNARYPNATFSKASDAWVWPEHGWSMSFDEARIAAEAEIEIYERGIAARPAWY